MNTHYEKAINLITSREKFHICLGLDRIAQILDILGNPQNKLQIIHVAGTNGKGSTCAILAKILSCAGYKTGLYTSPHIVEYTERIKINEKNISEIDFYNYIFEINELSQKNNIYLTEFELLTCCAYKYFADKKIDICVIETGLGGKLDATNIINKNVLSIITSLSLDHIDRLGDTIEKIAHEKAGIIKENCPVIINLNNKGVEYIKQIAKKKNSSLILANEKVHLKFENNKNLATYNNNTYEFPLLGLWQKENLELVFATIEQLIKTGYEINKQAITKGLREVKWICRMQYIPQYNLLIDGTHNPDGANVLKKSLDYYFPNKKRVWVYGSITTKDYKKVMNTLFEEKDEVYFYNFDYPNAVTYKELTKYQKMACPINLKELEYLIAENKDALIVLSGSFYMIGQILKKSNFFQNIAMVDNIY